jgi:micrococcal nuclease
MITTLSVLLGTGALATACSSPQSFSGRADPDGHVHGHITEVVDGDTVKVSLGGRTLTVRLIGVNTPETKHPRKPVECWGPEASRHTHQVLPDGTDVWLERDAETLDRYGRMLAYVHRADGLFVNLDLVAGGWAVPYPFPPNTTYESVFAGAASQAHDLGLGLWGACSR